MSTTIVQLHKGGHISTHTGWGPLAAAVGLKKKSLCDAYNKKRKTQKGSELKKPVVICGIKLIKTIDNEAIK